MQELGLVSNKACKKPSLGLSKFDNAFDNVGISIIKAVANLMTLALNWAELSLNAKIVSDDFYFIISR